VNTLRVTDALRSDVSVLGSIRAYRRVSLKGEKVEVTTRAYVSADFLISTCGSVST
jgi:hypothetical protein